METIPVLTGPLLDLLNIEPDAVVLGLHSWLGRPYGCDRPSVDQRLCDCLRQGRGVHRHGAGEYGGLRGSHSFIAKPDFRSCLGRSRVQRQQGARLDCRSWRLALSVDHPERGFRSCRKAPWTCASRAARKNSRRHRHFWSEKESSLCSSGARKGGPEESPSHNSGAPVYYH